MRQMRIFFLKGEVAMLGYEPRASHLLGQVLYT
jgi:hypothetical protein